MHIGYGSQMLDDMYVSAEMGEVFGSTNQLARWLDVESALARAQSRLGLVPQYAADEITAKALPKNIDLQAYKARLAISIHPIMPLVGLLAEACDGDAGEYVHWGATTQDIMDTGLVLQLVSAARLIKRDTTRLRDALRTVASDHRSTLMVGRTHGQHAVPITLGYKFAVYVDELGRLLENLEGALAQCQYVQFGGAAGTLASLGPIGLDVRRLLGEELGLKVAPITWHVSRDRLTNLCFATISIVALCRKVAGEVMTLQRTDIGEVEEPFHMGKIGSSTMPHKRNPMLSEIVWSVGAVAMDTFHTVFASSVQQHERDMSAWQIEWDAIPRLFVLGHRALTVLVQVVEGMTINGDRMLRNLASTSGLVSSEAAMMALARHLGRQRAHNVVYEIAMQAAEQGKPFAELLLGCPELADPDVNADVRGALAPEAVVEAAKLQVDSVLELV